MRSNEANTVNDIDVSGDEFVRDYRKIVESFGPVVNVPTQWATIGDYFQKLSIYDSSYLLVQSSDGTTLQNIEGYAELA